MKRAITMLAGLAALAAALPAAAQDTVAKVKQAGVQPFWPLRAWPSTEKIE